MKDISLQLSNPKQVTEKKIHVEPMRDAVKGCLNSSGKFYCIDLLTNGLLLIRCNSKLSFNNH